MFCCAKKKKKKKGKDNHILKIEEISNTCQSHCVNNPTSCHSFSLWLTNVLLVQVVKRYVSVNMINSISALRNSDGF